MGAYRLWRNVRRQLTQPNPTATQPPTPTNWNNHPQETPPNTASRSTEAVKLSLIIPDKTNYIERYEPVDYVYALHYPELECSRWASQERTLAPLQNDYDQS